MKTLFRFILLFFSVVVYGQDPIPPTFMEANPIWHHYMQNKNVIKNQPSDFINNNNSVFPVTNFLLKDSFLTVISSTFQVNFSIDGFIIKHINIHTGQEVWSDVFNKFNGADSYFSPTFDASFDKNGNIEVKGNRKIDSIGINSYPMAFRRCYDSQTGKVLYTKYDPTNVAVKPSVSSAAHGVYLPVNADSMYLNLFNTVEGYPDTFRYYIQGVLFNEAMDKVIEPFACKLELKPDIAVDIFSFKGGSVYKLNDTLALYDFRLKPSQNSGIEFEVKLIWINYKNPQNIFIEKIVDIIDKSPYNWNTPSSVEIEIRGNEIFIMDNIVDFPQLKARPYILKLDIYGNEMAYYDDIAIPNSDYANAFLLSSSDSLSYFICFPSVKGGIHGLDIVQVDNNKQYKYVASLTLNNKTDKEKYRVSRLNRYLVDGKILIYNGLYDTEIFENRVHWIMAWDLEELIKGSASGVDNTMISSTFSIAPNPSTNQITITTSEALSNSRIEIYDQIGRNIINHQISSSATEINISSLPTGLYFVSLVDDLGKRFGQVQKLVKIE
ncbi:MAG: T9SS type A sorting domain-containing protein [Saprospiraceae bacterium]|nr:T9SS type A sorting domain-containing protein [Saprospiraceae bacterium]